MTIHCPRMCYSTRCARGAHRYPSWLLFFWRAPCTGSQHTVNAVTNVGNGCRCSAAASGCAWVVMPRCCVRPRGIRYAVCTSVCVCNCACLYPQPASSRDVERDRFNELCGVSNGAGGGWAFDNCAYQCCALRNILDILRHRVIISYM